MKKIVAYIRHEAVSSRSARLCSDPASEPLDHRV